jgi:uncharacterized protein YkwD
VLHQVVLRLVRRAAVPVLLLTAVPTQATAAGRPVVPSAPPAPARSAPAPLMAQVVAMTNAQRRRHGCDGLTVDHELAVAAGRQSWYMARTGLFTHVWRDGSTFVTRSHAAGYREPSGENIAWGYENVRAVMAAWMASPGHRENILNCAARSIGTGIVYAANGVPYYTQVFGYE